MYTAVALGRPRLRCELTALGCWTVSLPSSVFALTCLLLIDNILQNLSSKSSTFSEFLLLPGAPFKAPQASPSASPNTGVLKEDFHERIA